jgi:hypothetical protein
VAQTSAYRFVNPGDFHPIHPIHIPVLANSSHRSDSLGQYRKELTANDLALLPPLFIKRRVPVRLHHTALHAFQPSSILSVGKYSVGYVRGIGAFATCGSQIARICLALCTNIGIAGSFFLKEVLGEFLPAQLNARTLGCPTSQHYEAESQES